MKCPNDKAIIEALVCGDSMAPEFKDGDIVLVDCYYYHYNEYALGDIVIALYPSCSCNYIIKEITGLDDFLCYLEGINASQSIDSRYFGPLPLSHILGKVIERKIS